MSAAIPALPFEADPLIAEAKERARRRRLLALCGLVLAAVVAAVIWVVIPTVNEPAAVGQSDLSAPRPSSPVYHLGTGGGVTWVVTLVGVKPRLWLSPTGGRTWTRATPAYVRNAPRRAEAGLVGAQFVDRRHGWLSSHSIPGDHWQSELDRTTDGGRTWQAVTPRGCCQSDSLSFHFFDSERGYVAGWDEASGQMRLFSTTDGGATWSFRSVLGRSLTAPGDVTWVDPQHAIAVSWVSAPGGNFADFRVSRTSDAGRTWTPVALDGRRIYRGSLLRGGITAVDGTLVVPAAGPHGSVVYTSSDGGAHWHAHAGPSHVFVPEEGGPSSVFSVPSPDTWVTTDVSGEHLFKTTDGGKRWRRENLPRGFQNLNGEFLGLSIDFASAQVGWAALQSSELIHTTDGGRHWTLASRPAPKDHKRG